jgi:hypothetical protein
MMVYILLIISSYLMAYTKSIILVIYMVYISLVNSYFSYLLSDNANYYYLFF